MTFWSRLRTIVRSNGSTLRRNRAHTRLTLETLEDRLVLSAAAADPTYLAWRQETFRLDGIDLAVAEQPVIAIDHATSQGSNPAIQDEGFSNQIGLNTVASNYSYKGQGYTVAVIDTGIDYKNAALGGGWGARVVGGWDFVNNDADPMDDNGHGTHVAGIIGSSNGTYTGIAPNVNFVALKVLGADGSGSFGYVEDALNWVIAHRAQYNIVAINLSLGTGNYNSNPYTFLENEFSTLKSQGVFIAAAAGNSFYSVGSQTGLGYPAVSPQTVSVGAVWDGNFGAVSWASGARDVTTDVDRIASFSQRSSALSIMAPGALITSTYLNNQFVSMAGTSMATPVITGSAVLIHQALDAAGRTANQDTILGIMQGTGKTVVDGDDENDNVTNTGLSFKRIDLAAALAAIGTTNRPPTISALQSQNLAPSASASQSFTIGDPDTGTSGLTLSVQSSNTTLIPLGNIILSGSGANRTISYTAAAGQTGSATITLTVRDPQGATATSSFTLTISQPATLPFWDTFTRADGTIIGSGWNELAGDLAIRSNALIGSGGMNLATLQGVSQADVSAQVDATLTASGQWAGLVARYSGPGESNLYFANWFNYAGHYYVSILRCANGVWTQLGQVETGIGAGRLRFDAVGTSLRVFINNSIVLSRTDAMVTTGSVGVRAGAGVPLDNFSASAVNLTNTALSFGDAFNLTDGSALSANWQERVGQYTDGSLSMVGRSADGNLATLNGVAQRDVSVQADFIITNGHWGGVVARYSGPGDNNMYFANWFNVGAHYYVALTRIMNGAVTQLGQTEVASGVGHLRFDLLGSSLKVYVNGGLALSVFDTALTTGSVGVRSDQGVPLDNFSATILTSSLPFSDAFTQASGAAPTQAWQVLAGQFSVQNGALAALSGGSNLAVVNGVAQRDMSVQADITLGSDQWAGVAARASGGDTYFGNWFTYQGRNYVAIFRILNGVSTWLGQAEVGSAAGRLRLDAIGSTLTAYVNGTKVVTVTDTAIGSGSAGIRTGQGATVDNFSAQAATGVTSFNDTFSGSSLGSGWQLQAGQFSAQGGTLRAGTGGLNLATLTGAAQANVSVQADITLGAGQWAGLVSRSSANGDMYFANWFSYNGDYYVSIFKSVNGAWTLLNQSAVSLGAGTMRFDAIGSSLSVTINGVLAVSATDSSIASGVSGIRAGAGGTFGNFASAVV
ncbi:MAG: S8 family serine peptidase [Gemmataceae bacterium]